MRRFKVLSDGEPSVPACLVLLCDCTFLLRLKAGGTQPERSPAMRLVGRQLRPCLRVASRKGTGAGFVPVSASFRSP